LTRLTFSEDRDVAATLPTGETDDTHQWFLNNQYICLRWRSKSKQRSERRGIPLEFQGRQFSLAWPSGKPEGYLVLERVPE
jgi:hypothetical protein